MNNQDKYNVTFSCGHEGTAILVGTYSDIERKIAYCEERGLCPTCSSKKRKQEELDAARRRQHNITQDAVIKQKPKKRWC